MRHTNIFMALSLGYNHQQMSEGQRQKSSEFYNRTASESNVYLNSFHYPGHSYKDQAFDTLSLESSDSMETSISACSPDNISRWDVLLGNVSGLEKHLLVSKSKAIHLRQCICTSPNFLNKKSYNTEEGWVSWWSLKVLSLYPEWLEPVTHHLIHFLLYFFTPDFTRILCFKMDLPLLVDSKLH